MFLAFLNLLHLVEVLVAVAELVQITILQYHMAQVSQGKDFLAAKAVSQYMGQTLLEVEEAVVQVVKVWVIRANLQYTKITAE